MKTVKWLIAAAAVFVPVVVSAQTDLRVSGPQAGFPIAVPQFCDQGGGAPYNQKIPETIAKDLDLSGFFNVLNPSSFVETPGKCYGPDGPSFSDWSVVGAEGLVHGNISGSGDSIKLELFLYDVQQQRGKGPVLGKRYEAAGHDYLTVAHRFANDVIKFFTGTPGIFGAQIAFVSRVGRFKEIFSMGLDGSDLRQLTNDRGLALSPSFSANGDSIVYTSYRTRTPELYIMSSNGSNQRQLTTRPGLEIGGKFLPDGSGVVSAASYDGMSQIVQWDMRGNISRRITNSGAIDVSPSLSPDGRQVAFTSNRGGGPQIYISSITGADAHRVSYTSSTYCTSPAWSPKGDKLAFVCIAGGQELFVANADGSAPVQLTFAGNNEEPAWSPDGRYILFSGDAGQRGRKNLYLLPLHTGVPKQLTFSRSEDSQPTWGGMK